MSKQLEYLLNTWEDLGNTFGVDEGGWKHRATAAKMVEQLLKKGFAPSELFILGRISEDDGWEVAANDVSYSLYCVTDSTGEFILQPGEDDGERTEQGVCRLAPPKGWTWVFVA